jgi:rubrerythrin
MANDHVFNVRQDPCERLTGSESPEQILQMAVELEKEALAFYLGLKAAVPTASGKDKVEIIIKAKMRHIGILNQELSGPNK